MPFTVITVKNVPKSLRGDLTKWMQEIATGVYVGNFNTKVREQLWNRVLDSIDGGEATISYSYRNEIGYSFNTVNAQRKVVELDGIPLVLLANSGDSKLDLKHGHSDAAKRRKSKKFSGNAGNKGGEIAGESKKDNYIILHILLEPDSQKISEISCFKKTELGEERFYVRLSYAYDEYVIDEIICRNDSVDKTVEFSVAIKEMIEFMRGFSIVSYGLNEEFEILHKELKRYGYDIYQSKLYDLKNLVKKDNIFIKSYDLEVVLKEYDVDNVDVEDLVSLTDGIHMLSKKVNKFLRLVNVK